jgi:hypothetical protein
VRFLNSRLSSDSALAPMGLGLEALRFRTAFFLTVFFELFALVARLRIFLTDLTAGFRFDFFLAGMMQESTTRSAQRYCQARALSIISSQMPLDLRINSTVSRIAPWPASAFVV